MQRKYVRLDRGHADRAVSMEYVDGGGHQGSEVEAGLEDLPGVQRYQLGLRDAGTARGEESHPMAQLDESPCQPYHHALGPAVTLHRQATMGVEGNVHSGPMYRRATPVANRAAA
jgi:hypothetical protein